MGSLKNKTILITGGARRIGRELALAVAREGGNIILHHNSSADEARNTADEIKDMGGFAEIIQADFSDPKSAIENFSQVFTAEKNLYALINNASIFQSLKFRNTPLKDWDNHFAINLTVPFLLSQAFAEKNQGGGKIINMLDWRALRPGYDHFPYTITKAALASMTKSMALSLAPDIQVNALALGAILPPADGGEESSIINQVPAGRWANMEELIKAFLFLLQGPEYITGEIIHLDGGRHLV